jgi:hypothetical protein
MYNTDGEGKAVTLLLATGEEGVLTLCSQRRRSRVFLPGPRYRNRIAVPKIVNTSLLLIHD